jgi:hemin uptake protein HemP
MNSEIPLTPSQANFSLPTKLQTVQTGISSVDILRGQKAVEINHNGLIYKLQATRLGKLILTK